MLAGVGPATRSRRRPRRHRGSPNRSSGTPTTTASRTAGWLFSGLLDLLGEDLLAAGVDAHSTPRPRRVIVPSASTVAQSPGTLQRRPLEDAERLGRLLLVLVVADGVYPPTATTPGSSEPGTTSVPSSAITRASSPRVKSAVAAADIPNTPVPRISQETLADMVGTTRSRVSFHEPLQEIRLHSLQWRFAGPQRTTQYRSTRLAVLLSAFFPKKPVSKPLTPNPRLSSFEQFPGPNC